MEDLPQELVYSISSFLELEDLKQTLLVSRSSQYAAEEHSSAFTDFSFWEGKTNARVLSGDALDTLDTSKESIWQDCAKFLNTYSGHRLRYLRHVRVHTYLPTLHRSLDDAGELVNTELKYPPCRENTSDLREKDECFTRQIHAVLYALNEVETNAKGHYQGKIQLTIFTPVRWVDSHHCMHRWFSSWRVHLLSPKDLPDLASVRGLSVCVPGSGGSRNVRSSNYLLTRARPDARVLIDLASRCRNLEFLGCELGHEEWRRTEEDVRLQHFSRDFESCQRDSRTDFVRALNTHVLPRTLRYARLDFMKGLRQHVGEQRGGGPNLVGAAPFDGFSAGLRFLTSHLRRLDLRLIADKSLFWPTKGNKIATWPNLEELYVVFHIITPSGSWYFQGPLGEGQHDTGYSITSAMYPPLVDETAEDQVWHQLSTPHFDGGVFARYRVIPNETKLVPFLTAFAEVARTMHALKKATLWAPLIFDPYDMPKEYDNFDPESVSKYLYGTQLVFGLLYSGPGFDATLSERELYWSTGYWRPDPVLRDLFHEIGGARLGQVSEVWHDGLAERTDFEDYALLPVGIADDGYPMCF